MNSIGKFIRQEGGAFSVIFAVMAPIFMAGAGLAVDVTYWYSAKRDLQNAADAGALAGGYEFIQTSSQALAMNEARVVAESNVSEIIQVSITFPSEDRIEVTVQSLAQTFFIGNFIDTSPTISANAIAEFSQGETAPPACLNLLSNSGSGLRIDGNGRVILGAGCGAQINSDGDRALDINGTGRLFSNDICVRGQAELQSDNSASSLPKTGCPVVQNPYQYLDAVIKDREGECRDVNQRLGNFNRRGQVRTYLIGTPVGGTSIHPQTSFKIGTGAQLFLQGGAHFFCHDVVVSSGATLSVTAHMIFMNGARLIVRSGGSMVIFPNSRGQVSPFEGLSIISHSDNNAVHQINGGGGIRFQPNTGISVPGDAIEIFGNSDLNDFPVSITAKTLRVGGNSVLRVGSNPETQPLAERQLEPTTVRLVN